MAGGGRIVSRRGVEGARALRARSGPARFGGLLGAGLTLAFMACGGAPPDQDEDGPKLLPAAHERVAPWPEIRPSAGPSAVRALPPQQAGQAPAAASAGVDESRRTAIVVAAERVAPAVVSINIRRVEQVRPRSLWEGFFIPPGYEQEVRGLGSGFIIREDGLVLTNEHVVSGAQEIVVSLPDGREYDAEIIGSDEVTDLALLAIRGTKDSTSLPVAPLGDSRGLMIGEWVVAIGNPLGYLLSNSEPTVTAGVVSGAGRNIIPEGEGERGYYLDMIQTDASINPGNSGGPLVNSLGEVIAVNSSILSRGGGSEGLGFAIPVNRARQIVADLLEDGRIRRAWIGANVEAVPAEGGGRRRQVRVSHVAEGSPAAAAGIRPEAVLEAAGGRTLRTQFDWEAVLIDARVGRPLEVVVADGNGRRTVTLTPEDMPSVAAERVRALEDFEIVTVTPAIRAERGVRSEDGALIVRLSPAWQQQFGLREGDVIVQINGQRVHTGEDAADLLGRVAAGGQLHLVYERQGSYVQSSFYIRG